MLENFWKEFRELLEILKLFLENFQNHEKFLENLSNYFNDFVSS